MADNSFLYYSLDPGIDTEKYGLELREKAKRLLAEIKTTIEWSGETTSATKKMVTDCERCIAMTTRFLKLTSPQKYGYLVRESQVYRIR